MGDLVTVTLSATSAGNERFNDLTGHLPHLVFEPRFEGRDSSDGRSYGGQSPPASNPLIFHVNLAPFWSPYDGQLYLAGGMGGINYDVSIQKATCRPMPQEEHVILMRSTNANAVPIPRGAYQVKQHANGGESIKLSQGGLTPSLVIGDQWSDLGFFSVGTFAPTAPATDILVLFKIRM